MNWKVWPERSSDGHDTFFYVHNLDDYYTQRRELTPNSLLAPLSQELLIKLTLYLVFSQPYLLIWTREHMPHVGQKDLENYGRCPCLCFVCLFLARISEITSKAGYWMIVLVCAWIFGDMFLCIISATTIVYSVVGPTIINMKLVLYHWPIKIEMNYH